MEIFYFIINYFYFATFGPYFTVDHTIMCRIFFFAFYSYFDYANSYDDREGFVGTPGPTIWRGSPACFAAERPPPKVSFFRAFGPRGLQAFLQQGAPRLGLAACAFAWVSRCRLRGNAAPHHAITHCTRNLLTPRCLPCCRTPGRNHPWRAGRAAYRYCTE